MNIERLRQLQDMLRASETYNQDSYFVEDDEGPYCRTPACIAGHAVVLFGDAYEE